MLVAALLTWTCLRPEVDPLTGAVRADERDHGPTAGDLAALEHALRLAAHWDGEVLAVVAGPPAADAALRDALACGATRVLRVTAPTPAPLDDGSALARALADALGPVDLVLTGDASPTPAFLAARLGAAQALGVVALAADDRGLTVHRRLDGGRREVLRVGTPAVVSVEAAGVRLRRAPLRPTVDAAAAAIPVAPGPVAAPGFRVLSSHPFRPRPRVLPAPPGDRPGQRVLDLTGALVERTPPTVLGPLDPPAAADELLGFLRKHGYLADGTS
ncbi:mycofactocin-associated electron transfer flavoprotein beta subunit [Actinokineospora sp.]|uniref:mycofactocin-associated electron transfer flavoprotein beta subunit n=1 Tax=Actinokineospora sp. TaxID=1872133 RepID=UPI0040384A5A